MKTKLTLICLLVLILIGVSTSPTVAQPPPITPEPVVFEALAAPLTSVPQEIRDAYLKGGVNASGWGMYDCDNPRPNYFDSELSKVAAAGAGHVRLLISMCYLENGTSGTLVESRFQSVVQFIQKATANRLMTVVDVHNIYFKKPGSSDWNEDYMWGLTNSAVADRHIRLMSALSGRLGETLPTTTFVVQPANEPIYVNGDHMVWYNHQARLIAAMRAACATCTFTVASHDWQGIEAMMWGLKVPLADGNVVYDMHMYEPMNLSHCGGYAGGPGSCSAVYPGNFSTWRGNEFWNYDRLLKLFYVPGGSIDSIVEWRDHYGVFINISEFGTTRWVSENVRQLYIGDLVRIFRTHGIGFTVYDWHSSNFGVSHSPGLLNVLFSGSQPPTTPTATATGPTVTPTQTLTPSSTPVASNTPTTTPTRLLGVVYPTTDPRIQVSVSLDGSVEVLADYPRIRRALFYRGNTWAASDNDAPYTTSLTGITRVGVEYFTDNGALFAAHANIIFNAATPQTPTVTLTPTVSPTLPVSTVELYINGTLVYPSR